MPTYDYRCPNGHDFEHFFRKISDAVAELACPTCGAVAQRRVSGGAGLLFKGSGFYLTDYGKNAHRTSAPPSSSGGESSGGSDSSAKSNGSKTDIGGSSSPKAEGSAASGAKSESTKSGETKSSSTKPKGGDAK